MTLKQKMRDLAVELRRHAKHHTDQQKEGYKKGDTGTGDFHLGCAGAFLSAAVAIEGILLDEKN